MGNKINQYLNYGIIIVISLLTLFIIPLLGSEIGLKWTIPNTVAGWIVWSISNLISAILNVLLFHAFIKQGKINIKDNPNYLKAKELLEQNDTLDYVPMSPTKWHGKEYRNKALTLFFCTILGTIGLGQAVLTFDVVKFIAQIISLVIGLIFGVLEMKAVEEYWTVEYYEYAKIESKKEKQKENV